MQPINIVDITMRSKTRLSMRNLPLPFLKSVPVHVRMKK